MAVFTAIATAIVGAIGITGTLATIATSFIAAGLAIGTAKILGVMEPPKGSDPGVKIQLPPATDNKVPRLYGRNFTGGTIIDAEIKNQNKTMAYCVVLSEMSDLYAETWTVNNIYRGDNLLYFSAGIRPYTVAQVSDPNGTTANKVENKIRVRVYAGGSGSAKQIFPVGYPANAYGGTDTGKTCQFLNWTSSNAMTDLVFAIIEIDYDAENDLVGLGAFTFDIQTTLKNPAQCLIDYLNNDRYGMGNVNFPVSVSGNTITLYNMDSTDLNEWANYAITNNTMINGGLSTFDAIRTNVNKICMSGGAFFTYNNKLGKFGVTVNRAASNAELANAFVLSDDNLVDAISVTSTDLFSMYNQMEVEFPSIIQKDQTDTVFLTIPSAQRNTNEPDNKLNTRFDLTNDREVAINLANIDLRQGRYTTVVSAKGDFTTMGIDSGDVVKLTNSVYGFNDKLFRVVQTRETETSDSMIFNELTLLEYNANVYTWTSEADSSNILPPGIPNWWNLNGGSIPILGNVYIGDNVVYGSNVIGYNPYNGAITSNTVSIDNLLISSNSSLGNTVPVIGVPIYIPANTTFDTLEVIYTSNTTVSNVLTSSNSVIVDYMTPGIEVNGNDDAVPKSYFDPAEPIWYTRDLREFTNLNGGDDYKLSFTLRDSFSGTSSKTVVTSALPVNVQNTIDNKQVAIYGAGTQLENFTDTSGNIANSTTFTNVITPIQYDLTGIDQGEYSLATSSIPYGDYYTGVQMGFRGNANITFANATNTITYQLLGGGTTVTTNTTVPVLVDNRAVSLDVEYYNSINPAVALDMKPVSANIWAQGYSTLNNAINPRQFGDVKVQLLKVNKNEVIA